MDSLEVLERVWEGLKARCCSDPKTAKRCVMVSKNDLGAALRSTAPAPECSHERLISDDMLSGPWQCVDCGAIDPPRPKYGDAPAPADQGVVERIIAECSNPDCEVCDALRALQSQITALVEGLRLVRPKLAHKHACWSCRPSAEWAEHGSASFENCCCEIKTIDALLAQHKDGGQ